MAERASPVRILAAAALAAAVLAPAARAGEAAADRVKTFEPEAPEPRVDAFLKVKDFFYLQEHPHVDADDVKEILLHVEGAYPLWDHLLFVSGEAVGDYAASDSEEDVELIEAYADFHFGPLDVRVGQQIFSWGSGVLFNPTDNLGRWRAVDPFDVQRRGVPAALVRYTRGLTSVEGIVIPTFERTELPKPGQRLFIYSPETVPNPFFPALGPAELSVRYVDEDDSAEPDGLFDTEQYAARLRTSVATWDIALSYFEGHENVALLTAQPVSFDPAGGTVDMEARYVFPKERVYGLDLAGTTGKLGLHLEAAYFDMEDAGENVGVGDEDYLSYVVGAEYPFEDVIGSHDLSVSLEYAGEIKDDRDDRIYINRVYQNAILARLKYTVDYRLSFELQEYFSVENEGVRTRIGMDYRWSDHAAVTVGAEFFEGPDDCFFGAYDDNDRVYVDFKLSF